MAPVAAQEVRTGGPPPKIRALLDGFVEVVNGARPESWEAFAQARFSSALLTSAAVSAQASAFPYSASRRLHARSAAGSL